MSEDIAADYVMDLDRTREQLLVFAREVGEAYRRERRQKATLDRLVEERRAVDYSMVQTLAFMVDAKDAYTGSHLERCRTYGLALAEAVDADMVSPELEYGFLLHDVGKVVVPEAILDKRGPLTRDEEGVMRTHVSTSSAAITSGSTARGTRKACATPPSRCPPACSRWWMPLTP